MKTQNTATVKFIKVYEHVDKHSYLVDPRYILKKNSTPSEGGIVLQDNYRPFRIKDGKIHWYGIPFMDTKRYSWKTLLDDFQTVEVKLINNVPVLVDGVPVQL